MSDTRSPLASRSRSRHERGFDEDIPSRSVRPLDRSNTSDVVDGLSSSQPPSALKTALLAVALAALSLSPAHTADEIADSYKRDVGHHPGRQL